jgi:hypothetical protein
MLRRENGTGNGVVVEATIKEPRGYCAQLTILSRRPTTFASSMGKVVKLPIISPTCTGTKAIVTALAKRWLTFASTSPFACL